MTKLKCADLSCKYNDGNGTCKARDVEMSWHRVLTVHDGWQEFLRCKTYGMSDEFRAMKERVDEIVKQGKGIV